MIRTKENIFQNSKQEYVHPNTISKAIIHSINIYKAGYTRAHSAEVARNVGQLRAKKKGWSKSSLTILPQQCVGTQPITSPWHAANAMIRRITSIFCFSSSKMFKEQTAKLTHITFVSYPSTWLPQPTPWPWSPRPCYWPRAAAADPSRPPTCRAWTLQTSHRRKLENLDGITSRLINILVVVKLFQFEINEYIKTQSGGNEWRGVLKCGLQWTKIMVFELQNIGSIWDRLIGTRLCDAFFLDNLAGSRFFLGHGDSMGYNIKNTVDWMGQMMTIHAVFIIKMLILPCFNHQLIRI